MKIPVVPLFYLKPDRYAKLVRLFFKERRGAEIAKVFLLIV